MTEQQQPDPTASAEAARAFRDDFGHALVAATRARERKAPRRRLVAGFATAAVAGVALLVAGAVVAPGERSTPLLGVSPAEAAVRQLSRSLDRGVLVRVAENIQYSNRGREVTRETDWTDLATRDRRTRIKGAMGDTEYWNTSAHERWSVSRNLRATDGRLVVDHTVDEDSGNMSASASPVEEVGELLEMASRGELTLRRSRGAGGRAELVLARRERCYATPDRGVGECPDPKVPDRGWPDAAPKGMEAVTDFATWWLQDGPSPRILRHENGHIAVGTSKREVAFRTRYSRWEVLPPTPEHLALVQPPAFPEADYLVKEGGAGAVGDAIRRGEIVCEGEYCPPVGP